MHAALTRADRKHRYGTPPGLAVKALIFDLDGTLYRNTLLDRRYAQALYHLIAERKHLSLTAARRLFSARYRELQERLGRQPSKLFTLSRLGISDLEWAAVSGRVPIARFLRPDPRLRSVLTLLALRHRLGIVTNNHRRNTLATLRALGIQDRFDEILTLSESRRFKPAPELYATMAERLGVDPQDCLSLGDRPDLDLVPAARIGMHVHWVRALGDLYRLPGRVRARPARRFTLRSAASARNASRAAAAALQAGRLAVVPTDTVYGLAALPTPAAVRWLYRAKGRAEHQPLVLLAAEAGIVLRQARVSAQARDLMARHWPGGLTLVLPARPGTPWGAVTRGGRSVAWRVPANAWLRRLLARVGGVLATTSANPSGAPAPGTAQAVDERILAFAEVLVDGGPCPHARPSTVAKVSGRRLVILRPGVVRLSAERG